MGFSSKKKQTEQSQSGGFSQEKLYLWVKSLESKVNNLLREMDLIKNDFIKKNNEAKKEVKSITEDLVEFKHYHEKTVEKIDLIIKELKQTAGSEDVETLKKYMELWNPLNFVTQKDLERKIDARMSEHLGNKSTKSKNKSNSNLNESETARNNNEKHSPFN